MPKDVQAPGSFKYTNEDIEEIGICDDQRDIERVQGKEEGIDLGEIELWELVDLSERLMQANEKARVRPYITCIAISLWSICAVVCLIRFLLTGELAILGPPTLLSVPVYLVVRYYFPIEKKNGNYKIKQKTKGSV